MDLSIASPSVIYSLYCEAFPNPFSDKEKSNLTTNKLYLKGYVSNSWTTYKTA